MIAHGLSGSRSLDGGHVVSTTVKSISVAFVQHEERVQLPLVGLPFYEWKFPDGTLCMEFYRCADGYILRFPTFADFEVNTIAGRVDCHPAPAVSDATTQHLYFNQVLPLVSGKLGKLVFHGSAVEIGEYAVAFMAESGRGKSTLAASFATGGHRLFTDDSLLIDEVGGHFAVAPSHPSIRLWADSEAALIPQGLIPVQSLPFTSKSRFLASESIVFCSQPRPLQRAYFLGNGSASSVKFERLSGAEATVEWVKHSFLLDVEDKALLTSHFNRVARLAQEPINYRLDYPRRFEDLASLRQAVIEHVSDSVGGM